MKNVMLDLHFLFQGLAPFWKKIQVEVKSFGAPADANIDAYIVFIGINDAKKDNNNYRYSFYSLLIPYVKLGFISPTLDVFPHFFMQLRSV